jgi:PAS domain S-box
MKGVDMESSFQHVNDTAFNTSFLDYQEILRDIPLGLWTWDSTEGNFRILNEAMGTLLNIQSQTTLPTEEIMQHIVPEDRSQLETLLFKQQPEGREGLQEEIRISLQPSQVVWLQLHAHSIPQATAQTRRLVGYAIDSTAIHQAQEQLTFQKQLSTFLLTQSTAGLLFFDHQKHCTYINEIAEQTFSIKGHEMQGKTLSEAMQQLIPDASLQDTNVLAQAYWVEKTQQPTTIEIWYPPRQSWLQANLHPFQDGMVLYFQDITTRKQTERRLQQQEQKFQHLLDTNIVGIAVASPQGVVLEANPAYLSIIGVTPEEVARGELLWTTQTPVEYLDRDYLALQQVRETGVSEPYEKEVFTRDGQRKRILIAITALDEQAEKVVAYVLHLTQPQVTNVHDTSLPLGILEHDIQAPLAAMNEMLHSAQQIIQQCRKQDEQQYTQLMPQLEMAADALSVCSRHLHKQKNLINDILDSTRHSLALLKLQDKPCNLSAIATEVADDFEILDPTHEIILSMPQQELWTRGDADRIRQVIANYLTNAFQYHQPGTPVTLKLARDQGNIHCQVIDRSPGLTAKQIQQSWQGYKHHQPKNNDTAQHHGLGLPLCRALIEKQGGQVGAESHLNEGSTFWFTLPDRTAEFTKEEPQRTSAAKRKKR